MDWELYYKKAERQRIDALELWCWRRLSRVPWPARRSNQSILKELSPEYSLEGQKLKLKLQYFGHLMRRIDSLEKTWILANIESRGEGDNREWDGWIASPTRWIWVWTSSRSWWWTRKPSVLQYMGSHRIRYNWATELNWSSFSSIDESIFPVFSFWMRAPSSSTPLNKRNTRIDRLKMVKTVSLYSHHHAPKWHSLVPRETSLTHDFSHMGKREAVNELAPISHAECWLRGPLLCCPSRIPRYLGWLNRGEAVVQGREIRITSDEGLNWTKGQGSHWLTGSPRRPTNQWSGTPHM